MNELIHHITPNKGAGCQTNDPMHFDETEISVIFVELYHNSNYSDQRIFSF